MAGRPRNNKTRIDAGTKRGSYNNSHDKTGKTVKENLALNSFWKTHTVADMMLLSSTELDRFIDEWLVEYQARQIKRDSSWWYPTIYYDPYPEPKKKRKVNTSFNSSFVQKKVI